MGLHKRNRKIRLPNWAHWKMAPKGNPTDEFQSWEILSGKGGQGSYFNPTFLSPAGESKVTGHSTKIITDKALHWLKKRDPKKPFLLYAQYNESHIFIAYPN